MMLDDTYAYVSKALYTSYHIQIGGMLQTNRTDETLLLKATKYIFNDKLFIEIFGHDGTNNYMNHALDMN